MLNRDYMLSLEGKLLGYHIRLKELHFSASCMDIHKLTDEFDSSLLAFDDAIMENLQPLPNFGVIRVGDIDPEIATAVTFKDVLLSIRGVLADFKNQATEIMYSGASSIVDEFFATVNKYIYLINIVEGGK